jgi:hypothetical protein
MSDSARVLDVDTLDAFRQALTEYADAARIALESVDGDVRRARQWLDEQLQFWKAEVRHGEEDVFLARQELARKKMMDREDHPVDWTDELRALQKSQAKLRYSEEKVEVTRHWIRQLQHELEEYAGPARALKSALEADVPKACVVLEEKRETLEEYIGLGGQGPSK